MASVYYSKEDLARISSYKGGHTVDHSIMYNYIISPLCAKLVQRIPSWLAPNVLTVGGLVANFVSLALVTVYMPTFTEPAPRWVYFALAACILSYMLMDNMDGKQSVRTGSSSPLGELLDHGCDSLCVSLLNIVVASAMRIGPNYSLFAVVVGIFAFYLPHWQEYFTHYLELGYFNGPTEFECAVIAMLTITGFVGSDVWITPFPLFGYTVTVTDLLLYFGTISAFYTIIQTLYDGVSLASKKGISPSTSLSQLIPLVIFWIFAFVWVVLSLDLYPQYPRTILVSLNILFSYLVVNCIVQRICSLPFQPFYWPIVPMMILTSHKVAATYLGFRLTSDENALFAFFWVELLIFSHFVYSLAQGLCAQLHINFWTIPYPNKATKKV